MPFLVIIALLLFCLVDWQETGPRIRAKLSEFGAKVERNVRSNAELVSPPAHGRDRHSR